MNKLTSFLSSIMIKLVAISRGLWYLSSFAAFAILLLFSTSSAIALTIATSANPIDGCRVIAPLENLAGQPITEVGINWESSNIGWNTSLTYDDSDAMGWHTPVQRDESRYGAISENNVWADTESIGNTPAYFRKMFTLDSIPTIAWVGSNLPDDFSNVVDDDAQIYINGFLAYDDTDGTANFIPVVDIEHYLLEGDNLIAVKAHDSFGINEHFSMVLRTDTVPEPSTLLLLILAALALVSVSKERISYKGWEAG